MKKFEDLLYYNVPWAAPEELDREFSFRLTKSNLHLWNLGDPIVSEVTRILVGIVTWSVYELRLLDALNEALSGENRTERVDIFDLDLFPTQEKISAFVPNIGRIIHPPIVGIWQDGKQILQASGPAGRDILIEKFALDREKIVSLNHIKNRFGV